MTALSVRIPRAVDSTLEAAEKHPWMAATGAVAVLCGLLYLVRPEAMLGFLLAYVTLVVGATWQQGLIQALRADNGDLEGRNAALEAHLRQVQAGEASAATMEIRSIGDRGETS